VISIKVPTDIVKYHLLNPFKESHSCFRYVAATNLANSKEPAITITETDAPANSTPNPVTEKYAAQPAIRIADNPTNIFNQFILL